MRTMSLDPTLVLEHSCLNRGSLLHAGNTSCLWAWSPHDQPGGARLCGDQMAGRSPGWGRVPTGGAAL